MLLGTWLDVEGSAGELENIHAVCTLARSLALLHGVGAWLRILTYRPSWLHRALRGKASGDDDHGARTKSNVTPKYKTKHRVRNWAVYEKPLRRRGNITVWSA